MTTVGIVGAGTMGAGIAQVALESGEAVLLHDIDPAALERARERIRAGLARRAARLGLDADAIDDWAEGRLGGLHGAATIEALAGPADLVVEAALEDLDHKRAIFRALDATARPDVILATNTSALSVTAIARGLASPGRVLGLHFFNPVPLMALVEVVVTERTDPAVADEAERRISAWGKTTVRCADSPGFIVNRVNRPFTIEALRMLEAGEASVVAIDAAMREAGYPMGPFELMDLTGVDVSLAAARAVWSGLGKPDRLRPSPIQEQLVAQGHLGRKTGRGFYRYRDGRRGEVDAAFTATVPATPRTSVTIVARTESAISTEAGLAAADGIATADDIALALRLGAGHPRSPFRS